MCQNLLAGHEPSLETAQHTTPQYCIESHTSYRNQGTKEEVDFAHPLCGDLESARVKPN